MNTEITKNEVNPMRTIAKKEFIAMWKVLSNSAKRKPTLVEQTFSKFDYSSRKNISFTQKVKVKGFIYPEHHILYNIVRGLPTYRGFGAETEGYKSALQFFKSSFNSKYLNEKLYEPFKDLMSYEEFEKILAEAKSIVKA